jgi:hypothetical protein
MDGVESFARADVSVEVSQSMPADVRVGVRETGVCELIRV